MGGWMGGGVGGKELGYYGMGGGAFFHCQSTEGRPGEEEQEEEELLFYRDTAEGKT